MQHPSRSRKINDAIKGFRFANARLLLGGGFEHRRNEVFPKRAVRQIAP
jgi:hypothetical protein